jgi:hypothetical protein
VGDAFRNRFVGAAVALLTLGAASCSSTSTIATAPTLPSSPLTATEVSACDSAEAFVSSGQVDSAAITGAEKSTDVVIAKEAEAWIADEAKHDPSGARLAASVMSEECRRRA